MTEILRRKCGDKVAHDPHEYSDIWIRGKTNIGFGQKFTCPGKIVRPLTDKEMLTLGAIAGGIESWNVFVNQAGRSPQGSHQTAASLVRKGMVAPRMTKNGVFYDLTRQGRSRLGPVSRRVARRYSSRVADGGDARKHRAKATHADRG